MGRRYFKNKNRQKDNPTETTNERTDFSEPLQTDLEKNLENLETILDEPNDLVIRQFPVRNSSHNAAIVYIDGLVNDDEVYNTALKNVQLFTEQADLPSDPDDMFETLHHSIISQADVETTDRLDDVLDNLLYGHTIFYLDGTDTVLIMDTREWETRSIDEPNSETVIRGAREGFIENMRINMVLVRRYIRDPNLRFETFQVGRRSKSNLVLTYIEGVVNPEFVEEIKRRIDTIDIDSVLESGYIEQSVEDSFMSPFPQLFNTERPDRVAAHLEQGKFALILDGSPFVLIAPVVFGTAMQSVEDYFDRWAIGTFLRALRYLAGFIAVFLPALYIALVGFQPDLIPTRLAISIAATREGVPFPPFIEALLMVMTMEILREAGVRLPTTLGETIGIVGGLVIGESAVQAGIVSPIMVIIVALNAIASFTVPQYSVAIGFRIILFGYMIAAAIFGIYGVILAYIMTNIHIANLRSIGVPYSTPFAPFSWRDWAGTVLRLPLPMMTQRPGFLRPPDRISAGNKGDSS